MKNLKIGAKIMLGFASVFALLLIIVITSVISSVRTGNNIDEVEVYSGLQGNANELMHILNETRINASVLYDMHSAEAYSRVSKQLMYCDLRLSKLFEYMNAYPELSGLRDEVSSFERLYIQWRTGIHSMNSGFNLEEELSEAELQAFEELAGEMRRVNLLAHEILSNTISEIEDITGSKTAETIASNIVTRRLIVFISLVSVVTVILLGFVIIRSITRPMGYMHSVLGQIGQTGDLQISDGMQEKLTAVAKGRDETAQCISALLVLTDRLHSIDDVLSQVANGDLTESIELQSPRDTMGLAVRKMLQDLNQKFGAVADSTVSVNKRAVDLSEGSRMLSDGSNTQAESISHLSDSITLIAQKIEANTQFASRAASLADDISHTASSGTEQMTRMTEAAADINAASQAIAKVIKIIDDIAFQTNILALNAAVEAARAGQHGKGFAVVAEEVRNLATKSADAAKDTGAMIDSTLQKAALGATIAEETSKSLEEIVQGIQQSAAIIGEMTQLSQEQSDNINQIISDIERVEDIVRQNNLIAQQSAGAAGEISEQSNLLSELVNQFRLSEQPLLESKY